MQIRDLFVKPIDRSIQGVIKVGQDEDANAKQELDEYVVTRELKGHFDDFFSAYANSIHHDTDNMGVWISGFFGSGKSHFLKILSYLLENREVGGKYAIDYFKDKINDQMTLNNIELAAQQPTDVVLFNIDSKAKTSSQPDENAIINVFLQVFNEMQGFSSNNFWIADMERQLTAAGKYDAFKEAFTRLDNNHMAWSVGRDHAIFKKNTIKDALVEVGLLAEGDAAGFMQQLTSTYEINIETFAKMVADYIQKTGRRIVFLVDEVGQFVGTSVQRMLNLQTVVEDLGAATRGKAWVVVTSQQAINAITDKINGQDFSKIQGRFTTRINMSSANVDEVIRKRLLAKTEPAQKELAADFDANSAAINNVIYFDDGVERKKFTSGENFSANYPFVPYQFNLLQDVLTAVRTHGSDGKHLAEGARSMLALFQESAEAVMGKPDTALIPFSYFFEGLKQFLDHSHSIVIDHAIDDDVIDPEKDPMAFQIQVLKVLFMVKYVTTFKATRNNIVTLMIDSVDVDRVALDKKVGEALTALKSQQYIEKNIDTYEFLTDAEQDVNEAINRQEVSDSDLDAELGAYLFGTKSGITNKYTYPKLKGRYNFTLNQYVDDVVQGRPNNDMTIRVVTPLDTDTNRNDPSLLMMSLSTTENTIVVDLPAEDDYLDMLRRALKIKKFILSGQTNADARFNTIKAERNQEQVTLTQNAQDKLRSVLEDANIYVAGHQIENKGDFATRYEEGLHQLVDNTYRNLNRITAAKSAGDIQALFEQNGNMAMATDENADAVNDVLLWLQKATQHDPHVTLQTLLNKFTQIPFGFINEDTEWIVAKLVADGKIQLKRQNEILSVVNAQYTAKDMTDFLTKKQYADQISIQVKKDINPAYVREMKDVADTVFNKRSWNATQPDALVAELKQKIQSDLDALRGYEGKNTQYPGHDLLQAGIALDRKLVAANDAGTFYDLIHNNYDTLMDWADDMADRGIKDFYLNASQQEIWDKALSNIRRYDASKDFISNPDLTTVYQTLKKLVAGNKAGHVVQDMKAANKDFLEKFTAIIEKRQQEVTAQIQEITKRAEERINDAVVGDDFKEKERTSLHNRMARILDEAEKAPDLTQLVAKPQAAESQLDLITEELQKEQRRILQEEEEARRRVEEEKKSIAEERKKSGATDNTKDSGSDSDSGIVQLVVESEPKERHIAPTYVSVKDLPIDHEWTIGSQEDVNRYVEELRKALLAELKADRITKLTL